MARTTADVAGILRSPSKQAPAGRQALAAEISASVRRTFPAHIPLYIINLTFFAAAFALLSWYGRPMSFGPGFFFLEFVAALACLWLLVLAAHDAFQLWRDGAPSGLTRLLAARMSQRLLKDERSGNSFHTLMAMPPLMIAFTAVKENIALIHPFAWDQTFAHWDRIIGFGRMPSEILQPVLDHPLVTMALNFSYNLWFFVMFTILIWQSLLARPGVVRMQFLLAFCIAWIVGGSVLAVIFSSAGPCFYDHLYPGVSPFASQAAYLHGIGSKYIWSLAVQDDLWQSYKTGVGAINGISAMPSMHVAVATLLALLGWRVNRGLGIALSIFVCLILLGSVHLLWHYAVDGIAGMAVSGICWMTGGFIARRWTSDAQA